MHNAINKEKNYAQKVSPAAFESYFHKETLSNKVHHAEVISLQFEFGLKTFDYWTQDMMQPVKLWQGFEALFLTSKRRFSSKRLVDSAKLKSALIQNNDVTFINEQLQSLNQHTPSFWLPTAHQNTINTLASYERIKTIEALCQNWVGQLTKALTVSKESLAQVKTLSAKLNAQILMAYQKLLLTVIDSDKAKNTPEDLPDVLQGIKNYMKTQPYIPKAVIHSTYDVILQASLFQASE